MKLRIRFLLLTLFLIFTFCFSIDVLDADNPKSFMDMIPRDSLAYISLSDMDVVYHSVKELPEWQELLGIEGIAEDLEKANQAIQFVPMLLGITVEEFLDAFGHKMAVSIMKMKGAIPIVGLVADIRSNREKAEYAAEQAATIPAVVGGAMIEEKEYRDVPYTSIATKSLEIKYGFLDDFMIAGLGGGFEKLVDFYKDGGKSIKDSPNFQFMETKVSPIGNIYVYADLERLSPILEQLKKADSEKKKAETKEAKDDFGSEITDTVLKSARSFALSLSLSGKTNEVYLHLDQEKSNPIVDLILAPQTPMSSVNLVPFADGMLIGIHVGDPVELLDKGLKLAESSGKKKADFENGIKQVEDALGIDLRKDLLSAITGEFAVMATLPEGQIETENKMKMYMQMAQTRQVILIGVRDEDRLAKTAEKLLSLAKMKTMPYSETLYKGTKIHTKVLPLDTLVPGLAIMPAYAFRNGLFIMGGSEKWIQETIDQIESPVSNDIKGKLSESRVLLYLDAGGIADFAGKAIKKGVYKGTNISDEMQNKLSGLGSVVANISWGSDGVGMKLISSSEDNWATKILRGVLITIYSKTAGTEEMLPEVSKNEE